MFPRIKIITPKCKINLDIEIMQFSLLAEETSIHMILYHQKRFYNRETKARYFFKSLLPIYTTQIFSSFLKSMISVNHEKGKDFQPMQW